DHEGLLVLRTASPLAAIALTAEIRIVDLYEAPELASFLALRHRLHDLLLHPPRRSVAHAKVALERQRRQVRLAGGQQMHGKEPGPQRHLRGFQQRAAGERGLVATGSALVVDAPFAAKSRSRATLAAGTAEAMGPACLVERPVALRFGAVAFKK